MGSRSGSDSGGGGNDMQVSGAEAAYSTEKGISTAADTRISNTSFSRSNDEITGRNEIDYVERDPVTGESTGRVLTTTIGTGAGQVDPGLAQARLGADTSMVGKGVETYSDREIERGYTDEGDALANVNGKYMTKAQMYSTGIIAKDPETGEDVMGDYTVDPETQEIVQNQILTIQIKEVWIIGETIALYFSIIHKCQKLLLSYLIITVKIGCKNLYLMF